MGVASKSTLSEGGWLGGSEGSNQDSDGRRTYLPCCENLGISGLVKYGDDDNSLAADVIEHGVRKTTK